jgi:hypothetical protein
MGYVDPGLQSLFMLLRQAGIPVGLEELRRLGTVFAVAPALDEDGLRQVIESVCIKSVEQQKTFRRVYERWLSVAEKQLASAEARFKTKHEWSKNQRHSKSARQDVKALPPAPAAQPAAAAGSAMAEEAPAEQEQEAQPVVAAGARPEAPDLSAFRDGLHFPMAPQSTGEADRSLPLRPEDEQARDVISPGPTPPKPMHPARMMATAAALVLLVVIIRYGNNLLGDGGQSAPDAGLQTAASMDAGPSPANGALLAYRPEVLVLWQPEEDVPLLGYFAVAAALGLGVWLLMARGRGRWLPSVPRAQAVPGAVALARGAVNSASGTLFLDAQDEETLVWGVGRFISDELSHALDIDRTVHETAAAYGRPVLRYEAARYNREVWLWVDESMDSPVARHLARDLAHTLRSSGLPVTVATFWGIPTQLRSGENVVTLDEIEAQRESAAVAVLTDGRLMHTAHRALDRAPALHELLRNLSFWPRVTFIDFGRGRLGPIVEPHGLRVIAPHDAPAALSDLAEGSERAAHTRLVGDARVWAAACALSSRPVDDPTALKLRRMLGLTVSPWAIETLREHADHRAGGMSWSCRGRADLMGWLLDAEELPEKGLPPPDSLLARIVAAWDRLLVERERAQRAQNPGWEGSAEQNALRVERAFVHIWDRPDEAATTLYELFHGPQQQAIRHGLGELSPRESADHPDSIPLPWALRHQRRETQVMLTEMGLGQKAGLDGRRSLPRPGRLLLALGLCAGVALGGAYALVEAHVTRETLAPEGFDAWPRDDGKPVFRQLVQQGTRRWEVRVHTPWFPEPVVTPLIAGQDYRLYGVRQDLACEQEEPGGKLLRCCQSGDEIMQRPRFPDRWSFVVLPDILYAFDSPGAAGTSVRRFGTTENLANSLLCSGTADGVFLKGSEQDMPDWSAWAGAQPEQSQLLVVSDDVPATLDQYTGRAVVLSTEQSGALLDLIDFEGEQTLAQRKPGLKPLKGDTATFLVRGMGACGTQGQPCCWQDEKLDFCELGLTCENGTCVPRPACEPDTGRCEGPHTLVTCNASGTDEIVTPCAPDEECRGDRCVPIARPCTPGHPSCSADGTAVIACEDESRRHVRKDCPAGNLCREGACYDIQAATVTFDVRMPADAPDSPRENAPEPRKASLLCTVGSESIQWRLDPPSDLRPVSRKITVLFQPRRPGALLEVACWLTSAQPREVQSRTHPWTRESEGDHRFRIPGVPGLQVVYNVRIHLTAPGSEAAPSRGQRQDDPKQYRQENPGAKQQGDDSDAAGDAAGNQPRRTQQRRGNRESQ